MKKFKYILLPILCFFLSINFVSCNDDNDEPENSDVTKNELIGKWQKYAILDEDGSLTDGDPDEFWVYNADGSFQNIDGGEVTTIGTYKTEGQILTIYSHSVDDPNDEENFRGSFVINGDQMTYSFEDLIYGDTATIIFKKKK